MSLLPASALTTDPLGANTREEDEDLFKDATRAYQEAVGSERRPGLQLADASGSVGWREQLQSLEPKTAQPSRKAPAAAAGGAAAVGWRAQLQSLEGGTQAEEEQGNFSRGFEVSGKQLRQTAYGSVALLGDTFGSERMKKWGLKGYEEASQEIQTISKTTDSFTSALEEGELGQWFSYSTGYLLGQVAQMGASALAGAAVGTAAAPGAGTIAGGVTGAISKGATQTGIKKFVGEMIDKEAKERMSRGVAKDLAVQQAITSVYRTIGATTATTFLNATQSLGSIYGEAVEEAMSKGEDYSLGRVWLAGIAATAVDSWADSKMLGDFVKSIGGDKQIRGMAMQALRGGFREGMTEGVQTVIERWGADKDLASQEAFKEYIDSAAVGVLGGGIAGGATGAINKVTGPAEQATTPPRAQQGNEITTPQSDRNPDRPNVDNLPGATRTQAVEALKDGPTLAYLYQTGTDQDRQNIEMAAQRFGSTELLDQVKDSKSVFESGAQKFAGFEEDVGRIRQAIGTFATQAPQPGTFKAPPRRPMTEQERLAELDAADEQFRAETLATPPGTTNQVQEVEAATQRVEPMTWQERVRSRFSASENLPEGYSLEGEGKYGIIRAAAPFSPSADITPRKYSHKALGGLWFNRERDVFEALKIRKAALEAGEQALGGDQAQVDDDIEAAVQQVEQQAGRPALTTEQTLPDTLRGARLNEGNRQILEAFFDEQARAIQARRPSKAKETALARLAGQMEMVGFNQAEIDRISNPPDQQADLPQGTEVTPPAQPTAVAQATRELQDAGANLFDVLTDIGGTKMNIRGQQRTVSELPAALTKVMEALVKLGYVKFKDVVSELMKRMRQSSEWGPLAKNVTPGMLRQAYNGLPAFEGKESTQAVGAVTREELAPLVKGEAEVLQKGTEYMSVDSVAKNGDEARSPWLMADGRILSTNGDHMVAFGEQDNTYSDFMRRTGAIRASFFPDPVEGAFVAMLHMHEGQQPTAAQIKTIESLRQKQDGKPMLIMAGRLDGQNNPEYQPTTVEALRGNQPDSRQQTQQAQDVSLEDEIREVDRQIDIENQKLNEKYGSVGEDGKRIDWTKVSMKADDAVVQQAIRDMARLEGLKAQRRVLLDEEKEEGKVAKGAVVETKQTEDDEAPETDMGTYKSRAKPKSAKPKAPKLTPSQLTPNMREYLIGLSALDQRDVQKRFAEMTPVQLKEWNDRYEANKKLAQGSQNEPAQQTLELPKPQRDQRARELEREVSSIMNLSSEAGIWRDAKKAIEDAIAEIDQKLMEARTIVVGNKRFEAVNESDENAYLWGDQGFRIAKNLPQDKLLAIRRSLNDDLQSIRQQSARGMAALFYRSIRKIEYDLSLARSRAISQGLPAVEADAVVEPSRRFIAETLKQLGNRKDIDKIYDTDAAQENRASRPSDMTDDEFLRKFKLTDEQKQVFAVSRASILNAIQEDMDAGRAAAFRLVGDLKEVRVKPEDALRFAQQAMQAKEFTFGELTEAMRASGFDIPQQMFEASGQVALQTRMVDYVQSKGNHGVYREEWMRSMDVLVKRNPRLMDNFTQSERVAYELWTERRQNLAQRRKTDDVMMAADDVETAFPNLLFNNYSLSQMRNPASIPERELAALRAMVGDLEQAWFQDVAFALQTRRDLSDRIIGEDGVIAPTEVEQYKQWVARHKAAIEKDAEVNSKGPFLKELMGLSALPQEAYEKYRTNLLAAQMAEAPVILANAQRLNDMLASQQNLTQADVDNLIDGYMDNMVAEEGINGQTIEEFFGVREYGTATDMREDSVEDLANTDEGFQFDEGDVEVGQDAEGNPILRDLRLSQVQPRFFSGVLTAAQVQATVARITQGWKNAPKITVVRNAAMLPPEMQARIGEKLGAGMGARGLFDASTGEVFLFSDLLTSEADTEFTLFHEVYGHQGMRALFGAKFDQFLTNMYNTYPGVRNAAEAKMADGMGKLEATEEVLADLAGENNTAPAFKQFIGRIIAGLREIGLNSVANWMGNLTNAELSYHLASARDAARNGSYAPLTPSGAILVGETGTPAFKRWFGDSKVVDKDGNPLVVYHGTTASDAINEFKSGGTGNEGVWFGELSLATDFATKRRAGENAAIYPVYLSIQRPAPSLAAWNESAYRRDGKYDGFIGEQEDGRKVYAVLNRSAQVKSSTGNIGTYDPTSSDIRLSQTKVSQAENIYEVFAQRGDKTRAYARFNPVTQSWILFRAMGADIRDRDGYNVSNHDTYEDLVGTMQRFGKLERRKRSGFFVDEKIPNDMPDIVSVTNVTGMKKWMRDQITRFQNEFKPVFDVVDALKAQGRITDEMDVKTALTLYERRAGAVIEDFREKFVQPIMKLVEEAGNKGASYDDINYFLLARHAEERNKQIARINKRFPDGGSGMSTAEADNYLKNELPNKPYLKELQEIGRKFDDMSKSKIDYMVRTGMISSRNYVNAEGQTVLGAAELMNKYKHYVNLSGQRDGLDKFEDISRLVGTKFNVKGREKRAMGRESMASDIMANTILSMEASLIRGQKNVVAQKLLAMLETNYDPNFAVIGEVAYKQQIGEDGMVQDVEDESYIKRKDVMVAKVRGIPVTMRFKDTSRGSFADAIHGMVYPAESNAFMESLGQFNRFIGQLLTTYNPAWAFVNFARDAQTLYFNAASDGRITKAQAAQMMKLLPKTIKVAYFMAANRNSNIKVDPELVEVYNEMKREGGLTLFLNRQGLEDQVGEIEKLMRDPTAWNKTKDKFGKFLDIIEGITIPMEIAPRLAAYKVVRDGGMSMAEAAKFSGEITVNFNMRGSNKTMRQLFLFFNPAVQGSAKIIDVIRKNPKRAGVYIGGLIALGALSNIFARAMGDEDEAGINDLDKIPNYKRATSVTLVPGVAGGSIPLPYGWNAFFAIGHFMTDTLLGIQPLTTSAKRAAIATFESYAPLGSAGIASDSIPTGIAKSISPTATLPIIEWIANENRFGAPIYRDDSLFGGAKLPNSESAFRSVSPISQGIARSLNELTGGNRAASGTVDVNPAAIDFLISSYLPGVITEIYRGTSVGVRVARGEEVTNTPFPLVDRFTAKVPETYDAGAFRRARELVETRYREFDLIPERRKEIREEIPGLLRAHAIVAGASQDIRKIRADFAAIEMRPNISQEEVVRRRNQLMEREKQIYGRAVKAVMDAGPEFREAILSMN